MPKLANCPSPEELQKAVVGDLPEDRNALIDAHLLECESCAHRTLTGGELDTYAHVLKGRSIPPAIDSNTDGERIEKLIDNLLALPAKNDETRLTGDNHPIAPVSVVDELKRCLQPAQAKDELGRLGGYRILKVLGSGGMGAVFLAHDSQLHRQVALKVMRPHAASTPGAAERFLREARAVAALRHDHILTIYQVGEEAGVPFLAMEYLEGESLEDRLKRDAALSISDVLRVGREIAEGLAAAHAKGLIHRDIKPANVWLERRDAGHEFAESRPLVPREESRGEKDSGIETGATGMLDASSPIGFPVAERQGYLERAARVKLLDFGLAHSADDDVQLTSSGMILGTPSYMAPEQAGGEAVDGRTDLFSLGVILYRMTTGLLPFPGKKPIEILRSLIAITPVAPQTVNPDVPRELSDLIERLLAKDAESRPQSAVVVARQLAQIERTILRFADPDHDSGNGSPGEPGGVSPRILPPTAKSPFPRNKNRAAHAAGLTTSSDSSNGPSRRTPGRIALALAGVMAVGLLAVVTVVIRTKDGNETKVAIDTSGEVLSVSATIQGSEISNSANASPGWQGWPADAPPPAIAPFDATQARKHQEAWAKYLKIPIEYTNSIGMKFRLIPPGEFTMGSTAAEIDEALKDVSEDTLWQQTWQQIIGDEVPQHKVILTQATYLGIHEVTQAEYQKVMGRNPSGFASTGEENDRFAGVDTTQYPVDRVIWIDAIEFCTKLSQLEKLKPFYSRTGDTVTQLDGTGYRLPTEAELEFAGRGGTTTKFGISDKTKDLLRTGWFDDNAGGQTHPVGQMYADSFGLFDVHGNVWEWAQDGSDPDYHRRFQDEPAINPSVPISIASPRALRGGAWSNRALYCRPAARVVIEPTEPHMDFGFRVLMTVDAVRQRAIADRTIKADKKTGDLRSGNVARSETGHNNSEASHNAPFDALDPAAIPAEERFDWQPKELVAVLGSDRQRLWHSGGVVLSGDGKVVAIPGQPEYSQLCTIMNGETGRRFEVPGTENAAGVALSSDGKQLFCNNGSTVSLFVNTGEGWEKRPLPIGQPIAFGYQPGGVFSTDGKLLTASVLLRVAGEIPDWLTVVWDISQNPPKQVLRLPGFKLPSLTLDGKRLAVIDIKDHSVKIFDIDSQPPVMIAAVPDTQMVSVHNWRWTRHGFLANGMLATIDKSGKMVVWDFSTEPPSAVAEKSILPEAPSLTGLLPIRTGTTGWLTVDDRSVRMWSINGKEIVETNDIRFRPWNNMNISDAAVNLDGTRAASIHIGGAVFLWEVSDAGFQEKQPLGPQPIWSYLSRCTLQLSPDGQHLATHSENGYQVWRMGGPRARLLDYVPQHDAGIALMGFRDNQQFVTGGENGIGPQCWKINQERIEGPTLGPGAGSVARHLLARNLLLLQTSGNTEFSLWNMEGNSRQPICSWLPAPEGRMIGRYPGLYSSSADGKIFVTMDTALGTPTIARVWQRTVEIEPPTESTSLEIAPVGTNVNQLAMSPHGRQLVVAAQSGLSCWTIEGNQWQRQWYRSEYTNAAAFSADGIQLAVDCNDYVALIDLESGRDDTRWQYPGFVTDLAFSPDGRHLLTANANGTVYVLRLPGGGVPQKVERRE